MPHKKRKGERPDGLIQRSLQIGYKPDGSPDRKYFYGHTAKEAEEKRDEYKKTLQRGSAYPPNITVAEWVEIFKGAYRVNINSAYLGIDDVPYARLVNAVGKMHVADVRESDLQVALNAVSGMSYSTVDKYRKAIRRVFNRAVKNKIIDDNPASDLVLPPYVKGTHRALERWEVEHIFANWSNPYAVAGLEVMIMLLCGLRRGEVMALEWDAVDLAKRTLEVRQVAVVHKNRVEIEKRAKTEDGLRIIPICTALFNALSTVPQEQRQGFVCRSSKGNQLSGHTSSESVEQFCRVLTRILNGESAENPVRLSKEAQAARDAFHASDEYVTFHFTCHDLRHTFATALYDAGVPVKAAQYFLGHKDIRVTLELYTHLSKERDAASRQQLMQYFDSWVDDRLLPPEQEPIELNYEIVSAPPVTKKSRSK